MIARALTPTERVMRSLPCRRCGAEASQPCSSKTGRTTTYDHSARFYDARREGLLPIDEDES